MMVILVYLECVSKPFAKTDPTHCIRYISQVESAKILRKREKRMSYVKKEDVVKAINSQVFMNLATKERLYQTVNAVPTADVVRDIFAEIESCIEYIEEQIEDKLPDAFLSVKEDIDYLRKKYVGEGGKSDGI